jgi:DnaJ domain
MRDTGLMDDPHAVLGVGPEATPDEAARAFRALAKRWHPDRNGGPEAAQQMLRINEAYELLKEQLEAAAPPANGAARPDAAPPRPQRTAGDWLPSAVRRTLGPELLRVLRDREPVAAVASGYAGGSKAVVAATSHRLVWLLDEAVSGRVRSLDFTAITGVEVDGSRPWRRGSRVTVRAANGKRFRFSHLERTAAAKLAWAIRPRARG